MRSKFGEFFSLSSLVQTLPTSSDGRTALRIKRSRYYTKPSLNLLLLPLCGYLPVELRLDQSELAGDLYGVKGHEFKVLNLAGFADVPLEGRRRALKGDVVTDAVRLDLKLPPDHLIYGLHPLSHRLA